MTSLDRLAGQRACVWPRQRPRHTFHLFFKSTNNSDLLFIHLFWDLPLNRSTWNSCFICQIEICSHFCKKRPLIFVWQWMDEAYAFSVFVFILCNWREPISDAIHSLKVLTEFCTYAFVWEKWTHRQRMRQWAKKNQFLLFLFNARGLSGGPFLSMCYL